MEKKLEEANKERYKAKYIHKASLQHDIAYGIYKDVPKGSVSNKVLRDNEFAIGSDS